MKTTIRINDLSRELGIKSRHVLEFLKSRGQTRFHHSSSIEKDLAAATRAHFAAPHIDAANALAESQRPIVRGKMIQQGHIRPIVRKHLPRGIAPKPTKYTRCDECLEYVLKSEIEVHLAEHAAERINRAKRERERRWELTTRLPLTVTRQTPSVAAYPPSDPKPRKELTCRKCHKLVHPTAMDAHMREHKRHPQLPEMRSARFSFVVLPPGHEWGYKDVFEHYRRLSRAHRFDANVVDWARIEKIETHLKPRLRSFGVKGWFGYAVYEFERTNRVVVECPIEGNATYVLWGDWQHQIELTKGELRHRYPGQFVRVIHTGNWIEDVRKALRLGCSPSVPASGQAAAGWTAIPASPL